IATLQSVKFEASDLSGSYLGEAAGGNRILVDRNAGGNGWFVDANPSSDSSFAHATSATRLYADPTSAPAGHVDLLTAIMHEMGHKLGLDDSYAEQDRDNLMYGYLTVGERRLPSKGQAVSASASQKVASHFLSLLPSVETIFAGASASVDGGKALSVPQSGAMFIARERKNDSKLRR